jgi:hypothetical protein
VSSANRQSVSAAVIDPPPASPQSAALNPVGTPAPAAAPVATPPAPATDSVLVDAARRWLDSLKRANPVEIGQAPQRARPVREAPVERRQPTIEEDPFFIPGSTTPVRPATPPISEAPVRSFAPPAPTSAPDTSPRRDSLRPVDTSAVTPV